MKRNKYVAALMCTLLVCLSAASAADIKEGSIKTPSGNKVILVGKISFKEPIDLAARKNALSEPLKNVINIGADKDKNYYTIGEPSFADIGEIWELGESFYYTAKPDKNGIVTIDSFHCSLFGSPWNYFILPAQVKIVIPEGAKFVYVGDFQYDLDYALRVTGLKHFDEFDDAQKLINRATGKNVDLMRGELNFTK